MAPWEEVGGTLLHRASSAGHLRGASCFLGDVAYASAEEWRRSTPGEALPELFSSSGTFEERRRAKRFEIMQSIIDNPQEPDKCRNCHLLEKKRRGERKNYFIELEHLRRAVHKMLDHCAAIMSPHAFIVLRESLQLGVRFLTDFSEEKEVQPSDSRPVSPATAMKASAEESQDIAALEEEIQSLSEENARLRKELVKLGVMDPTRLGIRSGKGSLSVEVQTEPVLIGTGGGAGGSAAGVPNYGGMASSQGESPYGSSHGQAPSGRAPGAARQRLKGGQVAAGDNDDDRSDDDAAPAIARGHKGTTAKRGQKAGKLGGGGESVLERDLARAKDELEAMRKKLAATERQLNEEKRKAPALAADNAGTLGGQAPGSGAAGTAGIAANGGVDGPGDVAGSGGTGNTSGRGRGRGRLGSSARGRGQHHGPGGYGPGSEGRLDDAVGGGDVPLEECAHEDLQAFARRSSGSFTSSRAKPVMVDKCVGGGPEPPPIPQLQGRSLKEKPPELELNKNAHTFQRSLRAQPSLGMSLSSTSNPAAIAPPGPGNKANAASSSSTSSASRKRTGPVPTGAASDAASAASIASASSKALHRIGSVDLAARSFAAGSAAGAPVISGFHSGATCAADAAGAVTTDPMMREAEPYLLQVWEQHPDSHKKPAEKELMRLGALTPAPPLVNIAGKPQCPL